ncbi:MAG: hypothetical protein M0Z60_04825 [Nitrospiraceae bacterium]|nr:hypothetical protein [Nitrospiraceae bacterium]
MRVSPGHLAALLAGALVLLPAIAFAGVKVELKNGRTIIADFCEETGAVLTCSKMGGSFEIEKKDIVRTREISGGGEYEGAPEAPSSPHAAEPELRAPEKGAQKEASPGEGTGRLEEIRKQKAAVAPEREKLLKEREKLQEELKTAPDWMPTKQYEELQKKNAELDKKIKKYNEEVGGLNREEKAITGKDEQKKD